MSAEVMGWLYMGGIVVASFALLYWIREERND